MANVLRTIKIRSNEQQVIRKSYNKTTINIPNDTMFTTDLSQSYLNLRLRLVSNNGDEITTDDLKKLTEKDLCICFGKGDLEYSPSCLIKSAVLKKSNGEVIESIPFSNIISQTLFQFQNNKESISCKSLLSGVAIESNAITGSVSSIVKSPIQVQIPLQDLFQICKSANFWMSATNGLTIELEFEDKKPLLKLSKIMSSLLRRTESEVDTYLNTFYNFPSLEFNESLSFQNEQLYSTVEGGVRHTNLNEPRNLNLLANTYFGDMDLSLQPSGSTNNYMLPMKDVEATVADMESLGLYVDNYVKLVFEFQLQSGIAKQFHFYNKITELVEYEPEADGVPNAIITGNLYEWFTTAQYHAYYMPATPGAPLNTDVIRLEISINPETGAYALEEGYEMNITRAYTAGQKYIIPSKDLAHYMREIIANGQPNGADCVLTVVASVAIGTMPEFTVEGNAILPLPEVTPAIGAHVLFEHAMYSDDIAKYGVLHHVELLNGNLFTSYDKADNNLESLLHSNKLIVTETEMSYLAEKGLILGTGSERFITNTCFDLVMQNEWNETGNVTQMIASKQIALVAPEIISNNKVYSNGAVILPNTGRKVKLLAWRSVEESLYELTFSDLHMSSSFGFSMHSVYRDSNTSEFRIHGNVAPRALIGFTNFLKMKEIDLPVSLLPKLRDGLTYNIDLLEVVLQQQTKNKKFPPPPIYSTFLVEPFTIEDSAYQFERQFNITQPNCYNVALLMPENSDDMVSSCFNRNVFNYRFQVNNISNTSTNIVMRTLSSDYPSSLHMDKLLDYFMNSSSMMKTFFGIRGLENATIVPSILPLKIYTANDSSNYYSNPAGFSLQLQISSDQSIGFIKKGSAYLIKSVIKAL